MIAFVTHTDKMERRKIVYFKWMIIVEWFMFYLDWFEFWAVHNSTGSILTSEAVTPNGNTLQFTQVLNLKHLNSFKAIVTNHNPFQMWIILDCKFHSTCLVVQLVSDDPLLRIGWWDVNHFDVAVIASLNGCGFENRSIESWQEWKEGTWDLKGMHVLEAVLSELGFSGW